jgi:phospholipid transport system substrate-binding protein
MNGHRTKRLVATRLFFLFAAALMLWVGAAQAAASGSASEAIRKFYEVLLNTMKTGPALGAAGRYRALQLAVAETFDLPYMTTLAVGPKWADLSASERARVINAFQHYTVANYANEFDAYNGQQFRVSGEQLRDSDAIVDTDIVKGDGTSVAVKYRLHPADGSWRIIDVYLDGSISQLAIRRSEFSSVLNQQGVNGLIATLNQKADALVGTSR